MKRLTTFSKYWLVWIRGWSYPHDTNLLPQNVSILYDFLIFFQSFWNNKQHERMTLLFFERIIDYNINLKMVILYNYLSTFLRRITNKDDILVLFPIYTYYAKNILDYIIKKLFTKYLIL